ncbi:hypothetical protein [Rhodalgimonas zhirmunskyi]|uniref:Uncharacterized protein n=1 Tax=Rhodalgimonas zhirmunskyi TaxID=2964767 RepID=A0AAJ1UFS4_9RHOB|nr:hypothetical protein [Rhodoalgimonas zhirmunskyi]MDQ2095102.1 hypothetical protein [Rhodoalgimonas zhirmunskyi]
MTDPHSAPLQGTGRSFRQIAGGLLLTAALATGLFAQAKAQASAVPPEVEKELLAGLAMCITFFETRDLAMFAPLAAQDVKNNRGKPIEGVFALPSGKLHLQAKRVDFGGPSCKILIPGYHDAKDSSGPLDTAFVHYFDGMQQLEIRTHVFKARDQFWNKVDKGRLVGCVAGKEMGLAGERNFINGHGTITFITPLKGDIPC